MWPVGLSSLPVAQSIFEFHVDRWPEARLHAWWLCSLLLASSANAYIKFKAITVSEFCILHALVLIKVTSRQQKTVALLLLVHVTHKLFEK